jgi:pimeloyl-ACP methyl ester carboxylesterase
MLMNTVRSNDGTTIAFDRVGQGPPLILVDGGLCYRALGPCGALAKALAADFTVFTYDRRGRGDSGDTAPYAVAREVDDIEALVREAGGCASLWGVSSGAALALEAANRLDTISSLALYEAPFIVDDSRPPIADDWVRLGAAVAAGRRSEAIKTFLKSVGLPALVVTVMRWLPVWSKLTSVAHTLPYDGAIVRDNQRGEPLPAARWKSVKAPTLVMAGGKSPAWIQRSNRSLADVLPNARYRSLDGQTHDVKAKAHAPVLAEFFKAA